MSHDITVLVTCWPNHQKRLKYLRETVSAFVLHQNSDVNFNWLVTAETDDLENPLYFGDLENICADLNLRLQWRTGQANLGKNLNHGLSFVTTDLVFYLQDDWLLRRPIPIAEACDLLQDTGFGGVRFWANATHFMIWGQWSILRPGTPWYYGDNPALWHRRFFNRIGPFNETGCFGTAEVSASHAASCSGLHIATPLPLRTAADHYFTHLGEVTSIPRDPRWNNAQIRNEALDV